MIIDWTDSTTFITELQEVDRILLIKPFTSAKAAQIKHWITAASTVQTSDMDSKKALHVVHAGVHCDTSDQSLRLPHKSWQLEAERLIMDATPRVFSLWTNLHINFDGYNGVLKPGEISYFLPVEEKFGWIAREDIAAVAAMALLYPEKHALNTYPLAEVS